MQNKILFLDTDMDDLGAFFRENRNKVVNVHSISIYKNCSSLSKKIILFLGRINCWFLWFIYGDWKKHIDQYDYFIVPSRKSCKLALKILQKKKVWVYYWNLVTHREMIPDEICGSHVRLCTFDKGDAIKYNMKFVDTYYFDLSLSAANQEPFDLFYVGINRPGRDKKIAQIESAMAIHNAKLDITLCNINDTSKRMEYSEVICRINQTKAILDLTREQQTGLTLRPLEALQFKKKLVTDNKNIINYPFYRKENIFILGTDDIDQLYDFINSPYVDIGEDIIRYYHFENWLQRVIDND